MTQTLFDQASDPKQYDNNDISWARNHSTESPRELFYFSFLAKYRELWKNASILEIGSGTGWLLNKIQHEAKTVHYNGPKNLDKKIG